MSNMKCLLCGKDFHNLKNHIIESHSLIQLKESNEFYNLSDKKIYERYKMIGIYFVNEKDIKLLKD